MCAACYEFRYLLLYLCFEKIAAARINKFYQFLDLGGILLYIGGNTAKFLKVGFYLGYLVRNFKHDAPVLVQNV